MSQKPSRLATHPSRFQLFIASFKHACQQSNTQLLDLCGKLKVWQHETIDFQLPDSQYTVRYVGRPSRLCMVKPLLGAIDADDIQLDTTPAISIYELPKANSLCIPACLTTVVALSKPIDEIVASYAKSLRRSLKKQLTRYSYQTVTQQSVVQDVDKTMLRPYATARNGSAAHHFTSDEISAMALGDFGRLDMLLEAGEPVGCHLGNTYVENGKRYWHVNRFGYTDQVFNDYKHLQEANSANLHLALVSARDNGYDYCDYGVSLAKPGDGLLEWKRRRKGMLKPYHADGCFYLVPPQAGKAQFFWDHPLFALEGNNITLHLGLPENVAPEDVLNRYKEMGYDGLSKVYLHASHPIHSDISAAVASLYTGLHMEPQVVIKQASINT